MAANPSVVNKPSEVILTDEPPDLNRDDVSKGKGYFWLFVIIFVVLCGCYLYLHVRSRQQEVSSAAIVEATGQLRAIELEINKASADAKAKTGPLTDEDLKKATEAVRNFRGTAEKLDFSASTLQLLGNLDAEVAHKEIAGTDTLARLTKTASAELESLRSPFLWSDRRSRWIEIAFWAELGTRVASCSTSRAVSA